ncbi:MAG: hypothetical protein Q8S13_06830, partial [Dehalococcoidia bacterium]|nr:hypothetical protein [Dehalococcoidia bacterium]
TRIVATGGRVAQEAALADPKYNNDQTAQLMEWFKEERVRRSAAGTAGAPAITVPGNGTGAGKRKAAAVESAPVE